MRLLLLLCLCLPALAQVRVEQDGRDLRVLARQPVQARARVQGGTARLDVFPAGTLTGRLPAGVVASRPAEGRLRFEWPAPPHTAARLVRSSDLRAVRITLTPAPVSRVRGVTADFVDRDLVDVIRALARQMNCNVYVGPGVEGRVTLSLRNAPAGLALAYLLDLQERDFNHRVVASEGMGPTLIVAPPEKVYTMDGWAPLSPSPRPDGISQEILLENVPAHKAMELLAGQYKNVLFRAHPTMNGFYVYGSRRDVLQIKSEVPNLDRPPAPAPTPAREFVAVKYADINEVKALLATLVPDVQYGVDTRQNTLILEGSPGAIEQVKELLAEFDRPTEQVMLDFKLFARSQMQMLGFTSEDQRVSVIKRSPFYGPNKTLQLLVSNSEALVLAAPRVATKDDEPALVHIGDRIPITSFDPLTGEFAKTYHDLGLRIHVVAAVGGDDSIDLEMETVVSVIKELVSGQYPRELCCNAKHQLSVQDGDSIALRRLVPPEFIPDVTRTPLLADLPIIGTMFHPNGAYPELVLMLTPHIMK